MGINFVFFDLHIAQYKEYGANGVQNRVDCWEIDHFWNWASFLKKYSSRCVKRDELNKTIPVVILY